HVGLAQRDHAGRVEAFDHVCVVRADEVGEHFGRAGRTQTFGAEDVLVRERDTGQRAGGPGGDGRVGGFGLFEGVCAVYGDEAVELAVEPLDAVEEQLGELDAG